MIPLIGNEKEFTEQEIIIRRVAKDECQRRKLNSNTK